MLSYVIVGSGGPSPYPFREAAGDARFWLRLQAAL